MEQSNDRPVTLAELREASKANAEVAVAVGDFFALLIADLVKQKQLDAGAVRHALDKLKIDPFSRQTRDRILAVQRSTLLGLLDAIDESPRR